MKEISKALMQFQAEMPKIEKNKSTKVKLKSGSEYKFDYADLDEIISKCYPVLTRFGLSISQTLGYVIVQAEMNSELFETIITSLHHVSGEVIKSEKIVPKTKNIYEDNRLTAVNIDFDKAQEYGSYLTFLRRYMLCAIIGVVADSDEDGNIQNENNSHFQVENKNSKTNYQAAKDKQIITPKPTDQLASVRQIEVLKKFFPKSEIVWESLTGEQAKKMFDDVNKGKK